MHHKQSSKREIFLSPCNSQNLKKKKENTLTYDKILSAFFVICRKYYLKNIGKKNQVNYCGKNVLLKIFSSIFYTCTLNNYYYYMFFAVAELIATITS